MLENYFPILVFILVGLAVGVGPLVLGKLVAPNRPDAAKTPLMSVDLRHLKMPV